MATSSVGFPFRSLGPKALLPLMIRTLAMPSSNPDTPRKDRPLFAGGAKKVPSEAPLVLKYWMEVAFGRSTSAKTEPKPLTVAGAVLPGTKKFTSTILLPIAVKSRCALNVWKMDEYVGLI